ncbi:hypothetical protein BDZ90DRAFT_231361 [Jaminaea rosea]|uniref:CENP-C homolog n=1 Tax=Jaminaea rosea TaxID=1569628 RepID=A0A316UU94_9BASI|nr:hypothetical protein BDZ90DRAFT_231361 [Jaminaea rosea]PWN28368.1 hypothetical protein BDZ90DRAFT_231361 [Jaminaea rosea]
MASTRRFHGPGVGGRTGMRVNEDVRSISGYLEAGRRAMDEHDQSSYDDGGSYDETTYSTRSRGFPQDSSSLYAGSSPRTSRRQSGRRGDVGSSSMAMDLENSYAPSPQSRSRSSRYQEDVRSEGESGDSVVDYGEAAEGYDEDGYEDDAGGRSSHSIGQNRGRPSGMSDRGLDSRRQSRYDMSGSAAPYDDDDQGPMDVAGGDMPSFNIDDSEGERDYGDGGISVQDEEEDDRERLSEDPEEPRRFGDDDDNAGDYSDAASAEEVEGLAEAIEEEDQDDPQRTPTQAKRGKGRPHKEVSAPSSVGKGKPASLSQAGHFESERVASSRGRAGSVIDGDVRRSTRHRYAPLEYWRGERAIYGRPSLPSSRPQRRHDSADADETIDENVFEEAPIKTYAVPVLREIIRYSRPPGEGTFTGLRLPRKKPVNPDGTTRPGGRGRSRSAKHKMKRSKTGSEGESDDEDEELDPTAATRNPEDGWDDETDPHGTVWDADRQCEVERRIACPYSQVRAKPATNSSFSFEKVFGVDEYMASGILEIPVGGSKPTKPTKDNNYSFAIWQGGLDIRVHRTMFRLGPGGMFMVPKGNTYSIENCSQRKAVIWFTQARHPKGQPTIEGPIIQRYAPWPQTAGAAALGDTTASPATIKRERAASANGIAGSAAEGGQRKKQKKQKQVNGSPGSDASDAEIVPATSSSGAAGKKKKTKNRA